MNKNKNPLLSGELPIDGKQARSNRILKQFHQKLPFLGQEVKLCEKILRQTTVSIRLQFRCKIVLEAQTCSSIKELKERLGIKSYNTIRKWILEIFGTIMPVILHAVPVLGKFTKLHWLQQYGSITPA